MKNLSSNPRICLPCQLPTKAFHTTWYSSADNGTCPFYNFSFCAMKIHSNWNELMGPSIIFYSFYKTKIKNILNCKFWYIRSTIFRSTFVLVSWLPKKFSVSVKCKIISFSFAGLSRVGKNLSTCQYPFALSCSNVIKFSFCRSKLGPNRSENSFRVLC